MSETPFQRFDLPGGTHAWIPVDVTLRLPEVTSLPPGQVHFLIYIPWDAKYLKEIEPAWRNFFNLALPYLHARSTNVHVATCLPFIRELVQAEAVSVDERVVYIAFILHDSGWSQMSQPEIAASLGVSSLAVTGSAVSPKLRHAELGRDLARRLLDEHPLEPPLTQVQKDLICQAILYHDRPEELRALGSLPSEIELVCDADHLWSFTHLDFWQDTIRKGVEAPGYLANLDKDLDGYFINPAAQVKARQMLRERAEEVENWQRVAR